jgi:hypothetical protein
MTSNEIRSITKKYENLTTEELAREFVEHDKIILRLWNNVDDETSDEHTILQDLICERFVATAKIGVIWDDDAQNWIDPSHKGKIKQFPKIKYWVD